MPGVSRQAVARLTLVGLAVALAFVFGLMSVRGAAAESDGVESCWGVVTSQLATSEPGSLGEHSSEQEEPRLGLGNLAGEFGFDSLGEFGSFLAEIDGNDETNCQ